jgi:hypothetical protein
MKEPTMPEHVKSLERSRRRWRAAAVASWVGSALLAVVAVAAVLEVRAATQREVAAMREAEAARMEAQRAKEEQDQAGEKVRRLLYLRDVGLAQRDWEAAGAKP